MDFLLANPLNETEESEEKIMRRATKILAVLFLLPSLSGCWFLAGTAAGGAGAYYVAKDERTAGQIAEDAAITGKIKTRLAADERVSALAIDVDTYMNVVTLNGSVPSEAIADRAVTIARGVDNVRAVRSRLTIVP